MATNLMEHCWNEVGRVLRTSRLTSLPHLPDLEYPKYGRKGAKGGLNQVKIALYVVCVESYDDPLANSHINWPVCPGI